MEDVFIQDLKVKKNGPCLKCRPIFSSLTKNLTDFY